MARRQIEDEDIRKIQRTGQGGRSYMITLPKRIVEELGWREKQKVVVKKQGKDKITIEDWKK